MTLSQEELKFQGASKIHFLRNGKTFQVAVVSWKENAGGGSSAVVEAGYVGIGVEISDVRNPISVQRAISHGVRCLLHWSDWDYDDCPISCHGGRR